MNGNKARGTPGIFLSIVATGVFLAGFTSWETRIHHGPTDAAFLISGVGDQTLYLPRDEDFHQPSISTPDRPHGMYRRGTTPKIAPDEAMFRVAVDSASGLTVYTDDATPGPAAMRYYLKTADGNYMEFGERNHWPPFEPAKSR